jgi:2,3-bisphosphoglycerate-dependent phosphoglycerate mutase
MAPLRILLVRHAEPEHFPHEAGVSHPDGRDSEWNRRPLSARGLADARALAIELARENPVALYASPYPRARQTIDPLAQHLGLAIETIDDLRERLLSPNLMDDYRPHMRRAWENFDYVVAGGESSREAQARMLRVLTDVRSRHENGTVVMASHGNLIALALHASNLRVDHDFWESMPLPAVYRLESAGERWRASGPGLGG